MECFRRRLAIEKSLLRGLSNRAELAIIHGVTPSVISRDITFIKKNWLLTVPEAAQEKVACRTKQLEYILQLCISSYEASKKSKRETTTSEKACDAAGCRRGMVLDPEAKQQVQCERCGGTGRVLVETTRVVGQAGDSTFLSVAKACIVECARLEGIHPTVVSGVRRTAERELIGPNGITIREKIEEMYHEAPFEMIVKAKAALDDVRVQVQLKKRAEQKKMSLIVEKEDGTTKEDDGGA